MAKVTNTVENIITTTDQSTPTLLRIQGASKGVNEAFKLLNPTLLGVSIGVGAMTAAISKSIEAFEESDLAIKKLNDSLKVAGLGFDAYSKHLQETAQNLQKTTRFSDEQVMSVQQLLVTYGVYGKTLDDTTKAVLDLAETTDKDAFSAAQAMAKAVGGSTDMLRRYGVTVDESIPKAERFAAALKQIQERMGGRAEGAGETLSGAFAQVKNAVSDLWEEVGKFINSGNRLTRFISDLAYGANMLRVAMGGGTEKENISSRIAEYQEKLSKAKGTDISFYNAMLDYQYAKLRDISKVEMDAMKVADEKFRIAQEQIRLEDIRKKQIEDQKKVLEEIADIEKQRYQKSFQSMTADQKRAAEDIIQSGNVEQIMAQRKNLQMQLDNLTRSSDVLNVEMQIMKEKERLQPGQYKLVYEQLQVVDAQKEATKDMLDKSEDYLNKLRKTQQEQRVSGGIQAGSSFLQGDAGGLAQGGASMLGASAGAAGVYGLLAQLVISSKELPAKISSMFSGFVEGLAEGIPALMDYLSGPFIQDLITKWLPAFARAFIQLWPMMIATIIKGIGEILKNLPNLLLGLAKGNRNGNR